VRREADVVLSFAVGAQGRHDADNREGKQVDARRLQTGFDHEKCGKSDANRPPAEFNTKIKRLDSTSCAMTMKIHYDMADFHGMVWP
jgi:hypothetical protein